MAGTVQRVQIVGRVGHAPDRFDPIGEKRYIRLSVASNTHIREDTGEWSQKVDWWKVRCYEKLGEIASRLLKKGDLVYIDGVLIRVKNEGGSDVEVRARDLQVFGSCLICGGKK